MNKVTKSISMIVVASAALVSGLASAAQTPSSATNIENEVTSAINGLNLQHPKDMHFTVSGHNVQLTGWARNPYEVQATMSAVAHLPGVDHVYSNVRTWSQ